MSGLTNPYHIWRSSLPNAVLNSISVLGELYPSWEQISAMNSKKAMHVTPTASRLLIGGLLLQTEKEGPSGVWRAKTHQGGVGGGVMPRRPPAMSTSYRVCHREGKVRATSSQDCHNLPASGGLGSRGILAWRPPSHELRQETIISCQNHLKMSLALQHLCFISENLH